MDLHEFQGKELFRRFGIPVSEGRLATSPEEARAAAEALGEQVVVKAQVLIGGRGKAVGIKLADSPAEAESRGRDILGLDVVATSPEECAAYLKKEVAKWGKVIKERGMRAD